MTAINTVHAVPNESTPAMSARIDYRRVSPAAVSAMAGLERFVRTSGLEPGLVHLVKLRASYINGCAYCVDVHTKDAPVDGETEQRLHAIPVWRETPFFTPRERTRSIPSCNGMAASPLLCLVRRDESL